MRRNWFVVQDWINSWVNEIIVSPERPNHHHHHHFNHHHRVHVPLCRAVTLASGKRWSGASRPMECRGKKRVISQPWRTVRGPCRGGTVHGGKLRSGNGPFTSSLLLSSPWWKDSSHSERERETLFLLGHLLAELPVAERRGGERAAAPAPFL